MRKTTLKEQERFIEKRKAELGISGDNYVPANSGTRRSPSKRALLQELENTARKQGRKVPFSSKL